MALISTTDAAANKSLDHARGSCSITFKLLSIVTVVLAVAGGWIARDREGSDRVVLNVLRDSKLLSLAPSSFLRLIDLLPDKYETDMVALQVRHGVRELTCNDSDYKASPLLGGKVFHVTEPMEAEMPTADDRVFFMLNGANDGVYVSWNGQFECIGQAAELAAAWLGGDRDEMVNGVRLYSQLGWPVRDKKELFETKNIVHVLLDFQLWQWPGIKKGYKYVLEDGVTLTMVGINPKVFDVEYFFTKDEADKIIEIGSPKLNRSMVVSQNTSNELNQVRTSHTAVFADSFFTRDFQVRSARLARLPSPSYVERLQLVRYKAGEFYRAHLDTFSSSREILPNRSGLKFGLNGYTEWINWAADKIRELSSQREIPEVFREGGLLFPNATDDFYFPIALLKLFYPEANATNLFKTLSDEEWLTWIVKNVNNNATGIIPVLLADDNKPHYLSYLVKAWERGLGLPELYYTFPKHEMNSISQYFAWVRWVKERISFLGDEVPPVARPPGELYPMYTVAFQAVMLRFVLDDYTREMVTRFTNAEWYDYMIKERGKNHILFNVLKAFPQFAELVIKTWEARVCAPTQLRYKLPTYVKNFHPDRYVTLFLYLNNETKIGGETVFPYSLDQYSDEKIARDGMDECSSGLAVPPLGLHASLFYVQTPEGDEDLFSRHGGCPPHEGTKWGSNFFMWNADADESKDFWLTE